MSSRSCTTDPSAGLTALPQSFEKFRLAAARGLRKEPPPKPKRNSKFPRRQRSYRFLHVPAGQHTLLCFYLRGRQQRFLRREVEVPSEGTLRLRLLSPE